MTQKRVLVTGAAGFIGSHTVDRLLAEGHEVLGIDNLSTGVESNLKHAFQSSQFSFEEADVAATSTLDLLVSKYRPDAMIHLAALVSVPRGESEPGLNYRLNIHATHEVCEAARRHDVGRIVFSSSAAVYGECAELPLSESSPTVPVSQYGNAKLISEQILGSYRKSYGIATVCFRYFNAYGPRQDPESVYSGVVSIFSDCFKVGRQTTIFGDGSQSRDFVYVADVAKANTLAATVDPPVSGVFNCATGVSTSLLELVEILGEFYPDVPVTEYGEDRAGDIKHSLGDPSALKRQFGFAPATPFAKGLKSLIRSSTDSS